jgi:predicted Ser/Thr protein kinase
MDVFEQVCRKNLSSYKMDQIGHGTQGAIYKIAVDGYTAAVKDISNKSFVYRALLGRWLLSREFAFYQKLSGVNGVPEPYKKIDRDGFIFEYVEGVPLSHFSKDAPVPPSFFDSLEDLVREIHSRGVVHSDLKHKKNILVYENNQPYLIDFGASWSASSSWNLPKRWLYSQFQQIDLNAVSKIRNRFVHGNPCLKDHENLVRCNLMERCSRLYQWIYRALSRKHKWKRRRSS